MVAGRTEGRTDVTYATLDISEYEKLDYCAE